MQLRIDKKKKIFLMNRWKHVIVWKYDREFPLIWARLNQTFSGKFGGNLKFLMSQNYNSGWQWVAFSIIGWHFEIFKHYFLVSALYFGVICWPFSKVIATWKESNIRGINTRLNCWKTLDNVSGNSLCNTYVSLLCFALMAYQLLLVI